MCGESVTANEDDHNLSSNNDELDAEEKIIPLHAFEDVHLVINAPIVVLIKDLHPDKGIED